MSEDIAVLIPVLNRPQRVAPLLASLATSTHRARAYFLVNEDDTEERAAIDAAGATSFIRPDDRRSWAKKINDGYTLTDEPWMLLGADDLQFHSGWVEAALDVAEALRKRTRRDGVIGTNDLGNPLVIGGLASTHALVHRSYADRFGTIDRPGTIVHEGYHHNFPDSELVATAKKRGLFAPAPHSVIEHLHPAWGKAGDDSTYLLGRSQFHRDSALFASRCRQFGLTFP